MQTFLPYPSCLGSARCLDSKRLGKQRVEVLQILKALILGNSRWISHPAVKMWKGYESCLSYYGVMICVEWKYRGYKDTCLEKILELQKPHFLPKPPWWSNKKFHNSHKSNLLRKFPEHYSQFNWNIPSDLPYFWPE